MWGCTSHALAALNIEVYALTYAMMAQELCLPRSKLYCTFYNDLFILKTVVTINGQPAEIDFSKCGEIALKCRYPEYCLPFGEASSQLGGLLRKYGVCQVSSIWFDPEVFIQVRCCYKYLLNG